MTRVSSRFLIQFNVSSIVSSNSRVSSNALFAQLLWWPWSILAPSIASVWLWNFFDVGSELFRFWAKNQHTEGKYLYFVNTCYIQRMTVHQLLGVILENKLLLTKILKVRNQEISDYSWHKRLTLKGRLYHFLMSYHSYYSSVPNRRVGWNNPVGWIFHAKLINV